MNRIALMMLFGNRATVIGMLLGVGFAALLIALQGAIFTGVLNRTVATLNDTRGLGIWVMDPSVQFIDDVKPLDDAALTRVRSVSGVAWAAPLYKGVLRARLPDGSYQACLVLGLDNASLAGAPPDLGPHELAALRQPDAVLVDRVGAATKLARSDGNGGRRPLAVGDTIELNDRRAVVAGFCTVSRTFTGQPTIYTTWDRARQYALRERRMLSFVVAGAAPGSDPAEVAQRITATTGLLALTRDQFVWHTLRYYLRNTPIPVNIGIGVVLAFIVGTAVTALTFAGFVQNNLRYLGALKAMGATNALLLRMTALQALVVAVVGFGAGVGLASFIGFVLRRTELAFLTTWQLLALDALAVLAISVLAALASLRTVFRLEPAVVFRS